MRLEDGTVGMKFLFSQPLQPALLNLKKYVGIELLEVVPLKSSFSIRMFQVFRAHRNRMAKYQKRSTVRYEVDVLKSLLGIEGKYGDFGNFKKRVLNTLEKEINQHTSIKVEWKGIRKGRSIAEIQFEFSDKGNRNKKTKQGDLFDKVTFEQMSYSQVRAFDWLVAFGVNDAIAVEMISRVGGSEFHGFEDWYFEEVIKIFEAKTDQPEGAARAGALVNWFTKKKVFEQGDHFATIMERLQTRKKRLQKERPEAWENRLTARGMSCVAFTKLYQG